jgi:hypothetical protein
MLIQAIQKRSAGMKRALGLFLVVFILYGTTVEIAHRHGRVLPDSGATSLAGSEQTTSPVSGKTCGDCLICQLHQNFSTTLVAFRLIDPPHRIQLTTDSAVPADVHSQRTGPTCGRAPPFIS